MDKQETIFLNSAFFVIGFVIVFSIVGILIHVILSAKPARMLMDDLRIIGGIIIIGFGILLIASTRYMIPFFMREYKIHVKRLSNSFASSFIFGIAFAIGWTPCIGPILGSIYVLAASSPSISFLLLLAYSLGLGIPFLIAGAFISKFSSFMKRIGPYLKWFNIISGLFLIAIGVLVVTGAIGMLSVFLISTNTYISVNGSLNFVIAIVAGILSFFSPCILPLVPAYFSYIGGTMTEESKGLSK